MCTFFALALAQQVYDDGDVILAEDDALENEYLYIIVEGSAKVARYKIRIMDVRLFR